MVLHKSLVEGKRVLAHDVSVILAYTGAIASTSAQSAGVRTAHHRSSALLDHLARLTRVRAESALTPLGLRARHLVALTVLRDHGSATQQSLSGALRIDRTNLVGLLNELEADGLIARPAVGARIAAAIWSS